MKNSQTRTLLQTLLLNDPAVGSEKYEAMMETYDGKRASVRCPFYSLTEMEVITGYRRETVCRKAQLGELPFFRIGNGHRKFPREEIDRMFKVGK
ncbi:hypothetical protein P4B35_14010 [Pontiellaceae bacterium B12227]|nr:hypothetical protein [Pontiellaceae bacterium B12227]